MNTMILKRKLNVSAFLSLMIVKIFVSWEALTCSKGFGRA